MIDQYVLGEFQLACLYSLKGDATAQRSALTQLTR